MPGFPLRIFYIYKIPQFCFSPVKEFFLTDWRRAWFILRTIFLIPNQPQRWEINGRGFISMPSPWSVHRAAHEGTMPLFGKLLLLLPPPRIFHIWPRTVAWRFCRAGQPGIWGNQYPSRTIAGHTRAAAVSTRREKYTQKIWESFSKCWETYCYVIKF